MQYFNKYVTFKSKFWEHLFLEQKITVEGLKHICAMMVEFITKSEQLT